MAIGYPPQPVFPYGIDSDYTLFLVYNTAESALAEDNDPWSEEIIITARTNTQSEVWANNGFANINGELIYYDAVDKDANGKVYRLKRCARNLGGTPTQFNAAGTMVRGFVVAEHHNQLVNGIILTEQFIGYDFTPDQGSLDWRIRNLQATPIIFDDFGCPDVVFHFTVVSSDPSAGTVINYNLDVTGSYGEFSLSFGDGAATSSIQQGTHTYAPNANIDPIVTFTNQNCQVVQTPMERDSVNTPQPQTAQTSFDIPNLPNFVFPTINIQSPSFPQPDMTFPPFQFPCFDSSILGISPINIPSVIMFEPAVNLPSMIDFEPINIPSSILIGGINLPSIITITGTDIPSVIVLNAPTIPNISLEVPAFPEISVAVPTFPDISVTWGATPTVPVGWTPVPTVGITWGSPPNVPITWGSPPAVSMNWGAAPTLNVNWGSPPTIQVNVTVTCPSTPLALTDPLGVTDDMLGIGKDLEVEYDISGFPSEIKVIPPDIPDIKVLHDIPSEIEIKMPTFPNIQIEAPELRDIKILPPETQLTIEAVGIPDVINLVPTVPIPERIELYAPVKIPETIVIEHDIPNVIHVEGLPDVIRLEHNLPSVIKLEMPDKPEIELVYKGSGIPVQVQLDVQKLIGNAEDLQCVALIPCPRGQK